MQLNSIKIQNLYKNYKQKTVLENLNLQITQGSIFGLLGLNGTGKTTLISILNYLKNKTKGDIKIYGLDYDINEKEIKSISSYIPQSYAFYPNLTVYENLEFFAALYGLRNKELKEAIFYSIDVTSLQNLKNIRANILSGGEKRRLNIALGLLNKPKIIYLDEPTVGIDSHSRKYILDMIIKLNKETNCTIIYTSHYMEEVQYLCDEIAILNEQKIVFQEKTKNIDLENRSLEDMFLSFTNKKLIG